MGFVIGWGNLNGVVSSNMYQTKTAPLYRTGHAIAVGYLTIFLFGGSLLNLFLLKRENEKRASGGRDYLVEGKTEREVEALGDGKPGFVYTL